MSTKNEILFHNATFVTKKQHLPRFTLDILQSIVKKVKDVYDGHMQFGMENTENHVFVEIRYDIGYPGSFRDPKPATVRIFGDDGNLIEELNLMKTPSGFVDYVNKFWTTKKWLCAIKFEYNNATARNKNKLYENIIVIYRNTKSDAVSRPTYTDNKYAVKYAITKVKPSIRTSRKPVATKSITVDSLNGRKTVPAKNTVSKLVGVRPTKKCNFKKFI
jgi:hypothetical protein